MRKIEKEIAAAMKGDCCAIKGVAIRKLSDKDIITLYESGLIVYRLYGHTVARYTPHDEVMELGRADWRTAITKSRINAIARAFGLPTVYQEDRIWYWTDGEKYTGARLFSLDKRQIA